jgi:tRNA uridine 5-carboxymethylaminomethyl modification enzyme
MMRPDMPSSTTSSSPLNCAHARDPSVSRLFLAGRSTDVGYEEAAAQGSWPGSTQRLSVRSARVRARPDESYIGVLVDDLVTRGCLEPYRMFTSRAEHRLLLRIDNADLRLTPRGRVVGLVSDARWDSFERRRARYERNLSRLDTVVEPEPGTRMPASQALRRPEVRLADLVAAGLRWSRSATSICSVLETAVKYEGYLKQEASRAARLRKAERRTIPRCSLSIACLVFLTRSSSA